MGLSYHTCTSMGPCTYLKWGCMQQMGVHAADGSACSSWECMQQMGVHAADGGACSRWGCMQQMGVHAADRRACSNQECMQQSRVHAADESACSRWECMQQMGVHAADGSACCRWECMQQMGVHAADAVSAVCPTPARRCPCMPALHPGICRCPCMPALHPGICRCPCTALAFICLCPSTAKTFLPKAQFCAQAHARLALIASNKAGIGGTWTSKQHSAHCIKQSWDWWDMAPQAAQRSPHQTKLRSVGHGTPSSTASAGAQYRQSP